MRWIIAMLTLGAALSAGASEYSGSWTLESVHRDRAGAPGTGTMIVNMLVNGNVVTVSTVATSNKHIIGSGGGMIARTEPGPEISGEPMPLITFTRLDETGGFAAHFVGIIHSPSLIKGYWVSVNGSHGSFSMSR